MSQHLIRRAVASDAAELARLTSQLGYPASEAIIRTRLKRMIDSSDDCLLVAEGSTGGLAGWIHGFLSQLLESDYRVEIGGLLVDERWRRNGIGRRLVTAVEAWAIERGAAELSVRCREDRAESHTFYESLLFRYTKTQRVFRKRTGNAA
jgi:GNAT superfamily N-acetyltransferase